MFDSPWWAQFRQRLEADYERAVNQMLGGDPDQMRLARERAVYIRYLVSAPERAEKRHARLTASNEAQEGVA
jgi:hypothetical protein